MQSRPETFLLVQQDYYPLPPALLLQLKASKAAVEETAFRQQLQPIRLDNANLVSHLAAHSFQEELQNKSRPPLRLSPLSEPRVWWHGVSHLIK